MFKILGLDLIDGEIIHIEKPKAEPETQQQPESHRQELFQLLKEGKITPTEYKELLGKDNFSIYQ